MQKKKHKIIAVDDDEVSREVLEELLTDEGYQVRTVESSLEVLELLEKETYDLVISDLVRPGMNGIEMLKRIRAAANPIPVIFASGFLMLEHVICLMRNGATDAIIKAFDIHMLTTAVERALKDKQAGYPTGNGLPIENKTTTLTSEPDDRGAVLVRDYYESGGLLSERRYLNDELEGVCRAHHPKGNLLIEAEYTAGLLNGKMSWFYDDGVPRIVETHVHGKRTTRLIYNHKGELEQEILDNLYKSYIYKDGKKTEELDLAFLIKINASSSQEPARPRSKAQLKLVKK